MHTYIYKAVLVRFGHTIMLLILAGIARLNIGRTQYESTEFKPEYNMLKILPIISSSTSQKNYPLFLFILILIDIISYYSHIIPLD